MSDTAGANLFLVGESILNRGAREDKFNFSFVEEEWNLSIFSHSEKIILVNLCLCFNILMRIEKDLNEFERLLYYAPDIKINVLRPLEIMTFACNIQIKKTAHFSIFFKWINYQIVSVLNSQVFGKFVRIEDGKPIKFIFHYGFDCDFLVILK